MMRSIFGIFLVLLMAMPHGFAQLNSYSRAELAFDNALTGYNPGFESGTVKWTGSGGTFTINSTAADQFVAGSKQFAVWDSDGAAQERCSELVKVPESGNCAVSLTYKVPSGTATHKIVAKDGSKDLSVEDVVSSTAAWRHDVEFPCAAAASNQARVCLRSVASNEPAIQLDGGYAGEARQVSKCGVDTPWVPYTPSLTTSGGGAITLNATSKTDPFGRWRRVGDSIEIEVGFKNGSGGAATGSAGTIQFSRPSDATIDPNKAVSTSAFAYSVGSGEVYPFSSNFSPSNATIYNGGILQLIKGGTTLSFQVSDIVASFEFRMRAKYPVLGWTASQCVTPDAQGWWAAGNISGANPSLGTSAVTAYTEITNGSLTLTPMSGSAPVGVMCSSTNAAATPSTGASTCSAGNESVGFNVNVPRSGTYEVCFNASNDIVASSGNGAFVTLQTVRTATNAQTILAEGGARTQGGSQGITISGGISAITSSPHKNCGIFNLSAGINGFRLMYEQAIQGSGPGTSVIAADGSTGAGQRDVFFYMKPISQQQQAILANSVSTQVTNGLKIESAKLTTTTGPNACAITSQFGTWLTGTPSSSGAGQCSFTIATGTFSSAPNCKFNVFSGGSAIAATGNASSATAATFQIWDAAGSGTTGGVVVECLGQR